MPEKVLEKRLARPERRMGREAAVVEHVVKELSGHIQLHQGLTHIRSTAVRLGRRGQRANLL
jgi:hypothetical protein